MKTQISGKQYHNRASIRTPKMSLIPDSMSNLFNRKNQQSNVSVRQNASKHRDRGNSLLTKSSINTLPKTKSVFRDHRHTLSKDSLYAPSTPLVLNGKKISDERIISDLN